MNFGPDISLYNNVGVLALAVIVIKVFIHIIFAAGVYSAAKKGEVNGRKTWLVSPIGWSLSTLVLGPFFAGLYWLIHHSKIGGFSKSALEDLRARREALKNET